MDEWRLMMYGKLYRSSLAAVLSTLIIDRKWNFTVWAVGTTVEVCRAPRVNLSTWYAHSFLINNNRYAKLMPVTPGSKAVSWFSLLILLPTQIHVSVFERSYVIHSDTAHREPWGLSLYTSHLGEYVWRHPNMKCFTEHFRYSKHCRSIINLFIVTHS